MVPWWPALLAAVLAVLVFRGALAYGFAQDDFAALGRAAGLLPRFTEPWRWLSLQGFFDLADPGMLHHRDDGRGAGL